MSGVKRRIGSLLIIFAIFTSAAMAAPPREVDSNFGLLSDEECWRTLPPAEKGGGQSLPAWARALAGPLPQSTGALLRLDFVHRARSQIDPRLRARMRWVAAHTNRCAYAEAYAAFDARRAGVEDAAIEALRREDYSQGLPAEKAALEFARKMTVNSAAVTDEEFASLVKRYGEKKTAAMVLLMAYANFQDRLVLCLGSPLELGGPKPPIDVVFAKAAISVPPGDPPPLPPPSDAGSIEVDPEWASLTYEDLQARIEAQRQRPTRLRVPDWKEVERGLPPGFVMRPNRMLWTRICLGYQPELAASWETLLRINWAEASKTINQVFATNLFWVTTRASDCPYCMGHSELLLRLAGFSRSQVALRSRLLAGNDWSALPPRVRRAFTLARKLTKAPWSVSPDDIQSLKREFGPERAAAIIFWLCRASYMTTVANGFQLRLEQDNDFFDYVTKSTAQAGGGQVSQESNARH
jgi:alkylhydroperoxidase family enzyme